MFALDIISRDIKISLASTQGFVETSEAWHCSLLLQCLLEVLSVVDVLHMCTSAGPSEWLVCSPLGCSVFCSAEQCTVGHNSSFHCSKCEDAWGACNLLSVSM